MGTALTPILINMALITLRTDQLFIRGRIIIMGTVAMAVIAMTGEIDTTVASTVKGGGTDFFGRTHIMPALRLLCRICHIWQRHCDETGARLPFSVR